jgi:antirestriction protein
MASQTAELTNRKEVNTMNHEHQRPNGHKEQHQGPEHEKEAREAEPSPEVEVRDRPRIYVASLSDYNAGRLHGAWIDADQEPEQIEVEIASMLARSPEPVAEEWAIHDYEGFGSLRLSEYESVERFSRIARGITEHGPAFAAWIDECGGDEQDEQAFEDCYLGNWPSRREFAEETLTDLGFEKLIDEHVPQHFVPYLHFDAEAYIRDVEQNGELTIVDGPDGTVFVFSG